MVQVTFARFVHANITSAGRWSHSVIVLSNTVVAGASAQNASESSTKVAIEDRVDESVAGKCAECNPRRDQLHQVGEL